MGRLDAESETLIPVSGGVFDVAHALRADGFDASEDGTGRGTPIVPVAFDARQSDVCIYGDRAAALDTDGHSQAVCFSAKDHGADASNDLSSTMRAMPHDGSHANGGGQLAVAFDLRGREGGAQFEGPHDTANIRAASGGSSRSYVAQQWAVRRLTPEECEKLQGVPVGYTKIPWRGKAAELCPDGPRYKALGNSWAVPVVRWIGKRLSENMP